jgi:hypothetical protein
MPVAEVPLALLYPCLEGERARLTRIQARQAPAHLTIHILPAVACAHELQPFRKGNRDLQICAALQALVTANNAECDRLAWQCRDLLRGDFDNNLRRSIETTPCAAEW